MTLISSARREITRDSGEEIATELRGVKQKSFSEERIEGSNEFLIERMMRRCENERPYDRIGFVAGRMKLGREAFHFA